MTMCRFCAEEVHPAAIKCKHCGEGLAPDVPFAKRSVSALGLIGVLFLAAGGAALFYFYQLDTSVAVPTFSFGAHEFGGGRVNNLGLMSERSNGLLMGGLGFGLGFVGLLADVLRKKR